MFLRKVITFSGLDGAGKTTVIDLLKEKFESEGKTVKIFTMYDDLSFYAFLRLFRDGVRKLFGRKIELPKEAETDPNFDPHPNSLIYKIIRSRPSKAMVLAIDTLSMYLFLLVKTRRSEIVLLDRTSYDYIVDVLPKKYKKIHISIALFFSFKPSLSVFVDTPAQVSFDRKGEFTVEYLAWRSVAYTQIFNMINNQIIIDNYNNSVESNVNVLVSKLEGCK
jgi:thymidylate kinase